MREQEVGMRPEEADGTTLGWVCSFEEVLTLAQEPPVFHSGSGASLLCLRHIGDFSSCLAACGLRS